MVWVLSVKPFEIHKGDVFYYADCKLGAFKFIVTKIVPTPIMKYVTLTPDISESLLLSDKKPKTEIWLDSTLCERMNKMIFTSFAEALKVIK